MAKAAKIGDIGVGGAGLSEGHGDGENAGLRTLLRSMRDELDSLYAKLDSDTGVADTDYADDSQKKFVK